MHWLALGIFITSISFTRMSSANELAQTQQLVVVSAESWKSRTGTLKMFSKVDTKWIQRDKEVPVVFGKGLAWGLGLHRESVLGPQKREGDGRAPAGIFLLGPVFGYGAQAPPGCHLRYHAITEQDYFVDDPSAKEYNRWVRLPDRAQPRQMWQSAEKMKRSDNLYELGIVIHHNMSPVIKARGSAVFFHIWRNATTPTVGCTAMSKANLLDLIRWLDPTKQPLVIQAPAVALPELQKQLGIAD
jgi:L,D-peptidoglycan transpeptidase YkuD (ErfK/YbiS/YcfS/YnhG family)